MSVPVDALRELAELLRGEQSVISTHVVDPGGEEPVLGCLAAAGERARGHEAEYALVVEAVREGYLLHYGAGRVVTGADGDLALLAGDYLYALGLERLTKLGDVDAVSELSDLISLAAQVHDGGRDPEDAADQSAALWLAVSCAVGAGPGPGYADALAALRDGVPQASAILGASATDAAARGGFGEQLTAAADRIDFSLT